MITNADGLVRWDGLPALDGYRWLSSATTPTSMDPEPERKGHSAQVPTQDGFATPSGKFGIKAQQVISLTGMIATKTSVRGRVGGPAPLPGTSVVVKVFSIGTEATSTGQSIKATTFEQEAWADPQGGFLFKPVSPGKKQVTAAWKPSAEEWWFASREFDLQPGEEKDLGVLDPMQGYDLLVRSEFVDSTGRPVPNPGQKAGKVGLMLLGGQVAKIGGQVARFHAVIDLELGGTVELKGMPAGRFGLQVINLGELDPLGVVAPVESIVVNLPQDEEARLPFTLLAESELPIEVRVTALLPQGSKARSARGWLVGDSCASVTVSLWRDGEQLVGTVQAAPGAYELQLQTDQEKNHESERDLHCLEGVVVATDKPIQVSLERGATVQGFVRTEDGSPWGGRLCPP